jgi:hypothetical protein
VQDQWPATATVESPLSGANPKTCAHSDAYRVLNQMQTSASTRLDDGLRFPGIILVVWAGILLTRSAVTLVRPILRFLIAQSACSVVQHQMRQTRQMQIGVGCLPKSAPESFPCWRQERVAI